MTYLFNRHASRLVLAVSFILAVAACGNDSSGSATTSSARSGDTDSSVDAAPEPATVRMGIQGNVFASLPITLAQDLGYFEDEALTVESTIGESTSATLAGLLGGTFDVVIGSTETILALNEGAEIKAVGAVNGGPSWSIIAKPDITSLEQLRGTTFGTSGPDGPSTMATELALAASGIDPSEINWLTAGGTGSRYTALQQGHIDATIVSSPFEFEAEKDGFTNLGAVAEIEANYPTQFVTVTDEYLAENRDVVVRYLRAVVRAMQFIHDPANEAEVVERGARLTELDPEIVQQAYDYWLKEHRDIGEVFFPPTAELDVEGMQKIADQYVRLGTLAEAPDMAAFVVNDYVVEAAESL